MPDSKEISNVIEPSAASESQDLLQSLNNSNIQPTTKPTVKPIAIKSRIDSIDAFRGMTIFAMLFVIMVSGYHRLPLTFPHFGSAPVSTFKHAGEDGDAEEWAAYEQSHPSMDYQQAKVIANGIDKKYTVSILNEKGEPEETFGGVKVWTAKPLHSGDEIIAIRKNGILRFQEVGIGCTFTDLVAPFFVFIVGLVLPLSRQRRGAAWWKHVGIRTIGLIVLGIIYISLILKVSYWWGILQAIGVAYFMGALLMEYPSWSRWVAVALIAAFHSWATWHIPWWVELGDKTRPFWTILTPDGDKLRPLTVHCTPWGSISYGIITIIGTLVGDALATRDKMVILRKTLFIGIVFTVIGYLLHKFQYPMNKDYVSSSYSIFTAGMGALWFLAFYWVIDVWKIKRGWVWFLSVFGMNALLAYFMQPVVRVFISALGVYEGLKGQAGWTGVVAGLEWTLLLWCVVWVCNKKNIFLKL